MEAETEVKSKPVAYRLTSRNCQFAQLVGTGTSNAEAFRQVYNPKINNKRASIRGANMAHVPHVRKEIERIRAKSEAKRLLTFNDRLEILANIIQDPESKKSDRISAISVYSKLSGDNAPERHEISGPHGRPIETVVEAVAAPIHMVTVRNRMELFKRRREAEAAASLGTGQN